MLWWEPWNPGLEQWALEAQGRQVELRLWGTQGRGAPLSRSPNSEYQGRGIPPALGGRKAATRQNRDCVLSQAALRRYRVTSAQPAGDYCRLTDLEGETHSRLPWPSPPEKGNSQLHHPVSHKEGGNTEKHLPSSQPRGTVSERSQDLIKGVIKGPTEGFCIPRPTTSLIAYWQQFLLPKTSHLHIEKHFRGTPKGENHNWKRQSK